MALRQEMKRAPDPSPSDREKESEYGRRPRERDDLPPPPPSSLSPPRERVLLSGQSSDGCPSRSEGSAPGGKELAAQRGWTSAPTSPPACQIAAALIVQTGREYSLARPNLPEHSYCCCLRGRLRRSGSSAGMSKGTRALESGGSSKLLVVLLLLGLTGSASSSRSPLPLNSASPGSTVGGGEGEVDVLCKKEGKVVSTLR